MSARDQLADMLETALTNSNRVCLQHDIDFACSERILAMASALADKVTLNDDLQHVGWRARNGALMEHGVAHLGDVPVYVVKREL